MLSASEQLVSASAPWQMDSQRLNNSRSLGEQVPVLAGTGEQEAGRSRRSGTQTWQDLVALARELALVWEPYELPLQAQTKGICSLLFIYL